MIKKKLTFKQELFCKIFATDLQYRGNATQSYIKAYNIDTTIPGKYSVANSGGIENMAKPVIKERIRELLEASGFNAVRIDARLLELIEQKEDKSSSVNAIKEFNKVHGRIIDRLDVTLNTAEKLKDAKKRRERAKIR